MVPLQVEYGNWGQGHVPGVQVGGERKQERQEQGHGDRQQQAGGWNPKCAPADDWWGGQPGGRRTWGRPRWCREVGRAVQRWGLASVAALSHFFKQETRLLSPTAPACWVWAPATTACFENKVGHLNDCVCPWQKTSQWSGSPCRPFAHYPSRCQQIGGNPFFLNLFSHFYTHMHMYEHKHSSLAEPNAFLKTWQKASFFGQQSTILCPITWIQMWYVNQLIKKIKPQPISPVLVDTLIETNVSNTSALTATNT